jgi:hypothetical protein
LYAQRAPDFSPGRAKNDGQKMEGTIHVVWFFRGFATKKPNNIFLGGGFAAPDPPPKLTLQQPWLRVNHTCGM